MKNKLTCSFSKPNRQHNAQMEDELRIKQKIGGRVLRKTHILTNFLNIESGKDLLESKKAEAVLRTQVRLFFS